MVRDASVSALTQVSAHECMQRTLSRAAPLRDPASASFGPTERRAEVDGKRARDRVEPVHAWRNAPNTPINGTSTSSRSLLHALLDGFCGTRYAPRTRRTR